MTIHVHSLSCSFHSRPVVSNLTANFPSACVTALTGASGSGKTTLLNLIGGLIQPDSGSITFKGENIAGMSSRARRKFRRENVGYLFQDYGLVPDLSVTENIKIGAPDASSQDIAETLGQVGLPGAEKRKASELSGGEQQRVASSRLILANPPIVLADEPTGALDTENSRVVLRRLRQFARGGAVVVVATHSSYIADNADRVVML
ncbi:ATP-binding cassette domain-containing protein [Corynebacterium renale]|uniref:ATP-binding cassette domain-containing protein n=1 Tax=Corynebacterium renale TaxID=1724 RepID=UPI000E1B6029|nr:ATP-binding cassette domain-containing protein [Corynebacterium renale]